MVKENLRHFKLRVAEKPCPAGRRTMCAAIDGRGLGRHTAKFDPVLRPQTSLESAARVADQVWAGREPQAANLPAAEE